MRAAVILMLPAACAWARLHERRILRSGAPLSESQLILARRVGVAHPERVRLLAVERVPPMTPLLRRAGESLGFSTAHTIGMTLRYGIFIRSDHWTERRLLVHELAHVAQYERLGGFAAFLRRYLRECIDPGYPFGALELEAQRIERAL